MAMIAVHPRLSAGLPQSSPDYVRISTAAAVALGLQRVQLPRKVTATCIELLQSYPQGCDAGCTYCALAHERLPSSESNSLLQTSWPLYSSDLIAKQIAEHGGIGRVCVEQVADEHSYTDLLDIVGRLRHAAPRVPVSALVLADLMDEARLLALREAGVDIIGIGLDAASAAVFAQTRGAGGLHSWEGHWRVAHLARRLFGPFRVNLHVIVGLGETDHDLVTLFYQLRDAQIACSLFAFDPMPGSALQDAARAPLYRHRRVQLVKFLIERRNLAPEALSFDATGALVRLDTSKVLVEAAIAGGQPFIADGCPDRRGCLACNRPFGSYRPGEPFRDYPFQPTIQDIGHIWGELRLEELLKP